MLSIEQLMPQTADDAIPLIISLLTLAGGLAFFFFPRSMFRIVGLQPDALHPEAIGEGRSSFAGFLIAVPVGCLIFQQPGLQQPGLFFSFACCWLFTAIGKTIHILLDGTRQKRNFIRTAFAFLFGISLLWIADPVSVSWDVPGTSGEWLIFTSAIVTVGFGLFAIAMPNASLKLMSLEAIPGRPGAFGEVRGNLAGFYLGLGGANLIAPGIFIALTLSLAWTITAFGRMISMLSDRGNTLYNWFALAAELTLAILPLIAIFGYAG